MGIDLLNPIQYRCEDRDLAALKRKYGKQITFHGGVDNQQLMPLGTPKQIIQTVKWYIDTIALWRHRFRSCALSKYSIFSQQHRLKTF